MSDTLYDTDFYDWTQEQSRRLREAASERINLPIDWENVAEEIESLGKSDLREVVSHLARVIEHLLKLEYSPAVEPRRGWSESVNHHRGDVELRLAQSPSLRPCLQREFATCWRLGRRYALDSLASDGIEETIVPKKAPYTVEQVLDLDWFPTNRHGLG